MENVVGQKRGAAKKERADGRQAFPLDT